MDQQQPPTNIQVTTDHGISPPGLQTSKSNTAAPMTSADQAVGKSVAPTTVTATSRNYIAQEVLPLSDLPPHEALGNTNTSTVNPSNLAQTLLNQALQFMNDTLPTFHVKNASTSSKPSTAHVELLSLERGKEAWFARRSKHENARKEGTADWEEFDKGTRVEHSEREKDYTPDVLDAHRVCEWVVDEGSVEEWREVEVNVYEMLHKLPTPLQPRCFSVLVLSAASTTTPSNESLVVQIPIDLRTAPGALYSNGRNLTANIKTQHAEQSKKSVIGEYVSIERLKLEGDHVVWEMATASDAKGNLPMGVQKLGTPGAVVKDVGLLVEWIGKQRGKR